jgi:hypothetical protein
MAFVEFDYLPFYVSCELDAYFRFALTNEGIQKNTIQILENMVIDKKSDSVAIKVDMNTGYKSDWNSSRVKHLNVDLSLDNCFFSIFPKDFNENINDWDVSNVVNMSGAFSRCSCFNQPLNNWNVSNVRTMCRMFAFCFQFNQPLDKWAVSGVKDMNEMFYECSQFNQPLIKWDVSGVEEMIDMFYGCNEIQF